MNIWINNSAGPCLGASSTVPAHAKPMRCPGVCTEPQPCCRVCRSPALPGALAWVHLTPCTPAHQSFPSSSGQHFHQPKTLMPEDAQELNPQLLAGEFIPFCARSCFYFHFSGAQGCCINQKKPDSAKFRPHQRPHCSSQVSSSLVALCTQHQGCWAENGGFRHGKVLGSQPERVSVFLAEG